MYYMFQYRGAIFRESFRSKDYKPSTLNKVRTAHIGVIKIFPDDGTLGAETCRRLILLLNCILLITFFA
jgi:hypothetical protein